MLAKAKIDFPIFQVEIKSHVNVLSLLFYKVIIATFFEVSMFPTKYHHLFILCSDTYLYVLRKRMVGKNYFLLFVSQLLCVTMMISVYFLQCYYIQVFVDAGNLKYQYYSNEIVTEQLVFDCLFIWLIVYTVIYYVLNDLLVLIATTWSGNYFILYISVCTAIFANFFVSFWNSFSFLLFKFERQKCVRLIVFCEFLRMVGQLIFIGRVPVLGQCIYCKILVISVYVFIN
eukprot:TRINITY_DN2912_c0_g1_i10.p3 TRINITY_DN2912_c0_g1~~TRINITY_DN2912_c0_g1_i10.p3  ORF type:complete len:230 (-),score=-15.34 TRINITY_DN2912_c0_g1_i10:450-1139(-)